MVFKPGQSGNPSGTRKEKLFRDALILAVKREAGGQTVLQKIANTLADNAASGDVPAAKEVMDRVDGKVAQSQIIMGDEDGGPVTFAAIERRVVDPPALPQPLKLVGES